MKLLPEDRDHSFVKKTAKFYQTTQHHIQDNSFVIKF